MKKLFINNKVILVIAALLVGTSCSKLDINDDPNNPPIENATPEVLFPSAVMSSAGIIGGQLAIVGGMWSQYWTQSPSASQYRTIDAYNLTPTSSFVTGPYQELFSGALADYQLAITKAKASQDWSYYLMNVVMKAYTYQVLVDLYDQVPYTEALQGAANLQPKFDDGYSIYEALLAEINDALSKDYRNSAFDVASKIKADFIFGDGGNVSFDEEMDNWEKFANTLKLKMYLRMVNAKPDEAATGVKALFDAEAPMLDVNAGVNNFENIPNASNPFYEYNVRRLNISSNLRASKTMVSWLKANNDPRILPYYGTANPATVDQGNYGTTPGGTIFRPSATDPVWFISEEESYFMQAEALERYYQGNGAKAMYDKAIETAFAARGADVGALLQGKYAYPETGSFEAKLEAIIVQKWASFYGCHALEAFLETNRTGYPRASAVYSNESGYIPGQLVYSPNGVTGKGNFPKRLVFPDVEVTRNSNTPALVPITTKVWWAK